MGRPEERDVLNKNPSPSSHLPVFLFSALRCLRFRRCWLTSGDEAEHDVAAPEQVADALERADGIGPT